MSELADMTVIPEANSTHVFLERGGWSDSVPIVKLADYVRLYRGLRDRERGRFSRFYVQPTEALESAAKLLGIAVPDLRAKAVRK